MRETTDFVRPHTTRGADPTGRLIGVAVAILALMPLLACVGPRTTLRFRLPTTAASVPELIPVPDNLPLRKYVSRDLIGASADRIRSQILGMPHIQQVEQNGQEIWEYTFRRHPPGMQFIPDVRLIGRYSSDYPQGLKLAIGLLDDRVSTVQTLWFRDPPTPAFRVAQLLGPPDRREESTAGETHFYRYSCFTSEPLASGGTRYLLNTAFLKVPISVEGNSGGVEFVIADQTRLTLRADGSIDDPSSGVAWSLRPNLGGSQIERRTEVHIITDDLNGIDTPGAVQAVFGWPESTLRDEVLPLTYAMYPLEGDGTNPARLVVTYGVVNGQVVVLNLGIYWQEGRPTDARSLRIRLGDPVRSLSTRTGRRQEWVYQYRIAADPPISGTPQSLVYGIRLTFQVRDSVQLLPQVEMERISLSATGTDR